MLQSTLCIAAIYMSVNNVADYEDPFGSQSVERKYKRLTFAGMTLPLQAYCGTELPFNINALHLNLCAKALVYY
jgi:hypothetical protein